MVAKRIGNKQLPPPEAVMKQAGLADDGEATNDNGLGAAGLGPWIGPCSVGSAQRAIPIAFRRVLRLITSAGCRARTPYAMPVRSLTQSVLRWPKPEQVLAEAQAWAHTQQQAHPRLRRVGVFGSYGRGTASVGSDLDQRLRAWPIEQLPLACDALVGPSRLRASAVSRVVRALNPRACWCMCGAVP